LILKHTLSAQDEENSMLAESLILHHSTRTANSISTPIEFIVTNDFLEKIHPYLCTASSSIYKKPL